MLKADYFLLFDYNTHFSWCICLLNTSLLVLMFLLKRKQFPCVSNSWSPPYMLFKNPTGSLHNQTFKTFPAHDDLANTNKLETGGGSFAPTHSFSTNFKVARKVLARYFKTTREEKQTGCMHKYKGCIITLTSTTPIRLICYHCATKYTSANTWGIQTLPYTSPGQN